VTSGTSVQLTSGTTVQLTSGTSVQQTPLLVAMVPDREARNRQIFREFLGDHKLMRHDGGFAGPANLVPFWQAFAAEKMPIPTHHAIQFPPAMFLSRKQNLRGAGG